MRTSRAISRASAPEAPTLYGYSSSSAAYRVRIGLALKGIAYRRVVIRRLDGIEEPDYRGVNPQGFVPTLALDEGRLIPSTAILEYLDERWPDPPLLPRDRVGHARVRALAALVVSDIQPLNNQRVQSTARCLVRGQPAAVRARWAAAQSSCQGWPEAIGLCPIPRREGQ